MVMAFLDECSVNYRLRMLFCLTLMLVITGQPLMTAAADADRNIFQSILQDSLTVLWTGQKFSPELKQRQQTMKTMLTSGTVTKAELESMIEKTALSILDRYQTSRYILKAVPDRANALFSPHMDWEEIKTIVWRAASSAAQASDPILFKIGSLAPPGTPWLNVPETTVLPEIEKLTGGKFLFKIYGGGVMGEDTDVLRKMGEGQLDSCGCTALGVLEASPEASVLLLPGLFKNYDEVDYICKKFRKWLDQSFEKNGYILAGLIDTGYYYWFSINKVTSLEDIKELNTLSWFGSIESTFYQELGIAATPVAVPDTVSALSTGKGNVNMAPAAWMLGMQAYQYSNYYLKPPILYSPGAILISTKTVDKLQKQLELSETYAKNILELLVAEVNALEPEWNNQIRRYEEKSLKAFETKCGMKAVTFSPEDQQAIKRAGKAVQQKLAGSVFPKRLIDDIQKALTEYRAQN